MEADHSLSRIHDLAEQTLSALPEKFRVHASHIQLVVSEWPDEDLLKELGIDDAYELTGLYEGIPLTEKSSSDPGLYPDRISLFRAPLLAELDDRPDVSLQELVQHVVVHELAHHFGWTDEDIARVDQWWL